MNQQYFRNLVYLSDRSGTGQWRRIWPINSLNCISQNTGIICDYSQTPILDPRFYQGVNSITVQRWVSDQQVQLMDQLFKPVMERNGGWLVYEIDDLMFDGTLLNKDKEDSIVKKYGKPSRRIGIPQFNRGRAAFEGEHTQTNIKNMLNTSDFVIVTTDYIKNIYHDLYDVPLENIIAFPNLLPRYIFGDRYDPEKKKNELKQNKAKPRIGIISSLSHFNVDNVREDDEGYCVRQEKDPKGQPVKDQNGKEIWKNELGNVIPFEKTHKITDDFDEVVECIRSTVDDFHYVCFGYCPPQIKDLADKGKIEVHGYVPIYNYPSKLENLHLQGIIAPIKKTEFNYSKSFIKYMECSAIGVPLFATNCLPYNRVMPKDQLFDTSDELKEKLLKFKFMSTGSYMDIIERQWKWLNRDCIEGDFHIKNFWMEDNMNLWIDMMRLRNKGRVASMRFIHEQKLKEEKDRKERLLFENDNGVEILR